MGLGFLSKREGLIRQAPPTSWSPTLGHAHVAPPEAPPPSSHARSPASSAQGSASRGSPSHSPHKAPPHLQQALLLLGGLGLVLQAGQLLPHALQLLPAPPHQVGQHVVHVHAIEDVLAQLLPRHLGRGARPARERSTGRPPARTGAAGRAPGVGNSFHPPTSSPVTFSGGGDALAGWDRGAPPAASPPWCSGSVPASWEHPSRRPWRWSAGRTVGRRQPS